MSDDFQPLWEVGEADELPVDLTKIYRQLKNDGTAWSSRVPDTASLEDFVTTLAAGKDSQPLIENRRKGFMPMKVTDDYIDMPMDERTAPAPLPAPQRPRAFIAPIAAVLLVILLAAVFVWRTQHHATTPASTATSTGLPDHATYTAATLSADGSIWQAGIVFNGNIATPTGGNIATPTGGAGFVAHYANGHWHVVDATSFPDVVLTAIGMSSDTEGWAIGYKYVKGQIDALSVLYHYVNGHWQKTTVTTPMPVYASFQFTGQNHAWLLVAGGSDGALLHYDGATWQTVATPEAFDAMTMLSDTVGWFAGAQRLWHLQNGQFTNPFSIVGQGRKTFTSLNFTAPNDGWALTSEFSATNTGPLPTTVLHYDGTQWTPMPTAVQIMPSPAYFLYGLSMHSARDGWGIIYESSQANKPFDYVTQPSYLAHYTNGTWQLLQTPTGIFFSAISMSTATDGWAIGVKYTADGSPNMNQPSILLHYQNGVWNVVG